MLGISKWISNFLVMSVGCVDSPQCLHSTWVHTEEVTHHLAPRKCNSRTSYSAICSQEGTLPRFYDFKHQIVSPVCRQAGSMNDSY